MTEGDKTLLQALRELDPDNDDHWTSDGVPRISAVHDLMGNDEAGRKDIVEIAPDLNRESARDPGSLAMNRGATLEGQLQEAQEELEAAEQRTKDLRREVKLKQLELEAETPKLSDRESIAEFLASENEQRRRRYAKRQEILGVLEPGELDPRSPLDAAMARKRSRGTERPRRNITA